MFYGQRFWPTCDFQFRDLNVTYQWSLRILSPCYHGQRNGPESFHYYHGQTTDYRQTCTVEERHSVCDALMVAVTILDIQSEEKIIVPLLVCIAYFFHRLCLLTSAKEWMIMTCKPSVGHYKPEWYSGVCISEMSLRVRVIVWYIIKYDELARKYAYNNVVCRPSEEIDMYTITIRKQRCALWLMIKLFFFQRPFCFWNKPIG